MEKRKRGRPKKKDLVTKTEFARRCGMHLSQVSAYTGGTKPRIVVDEKTGKIDLRDPVNNTFLDDRIVRADKKNERGTMDIDNRIMLAKLMKDEASARFAEVRAREKLHDLIDKRLVESVILLIGKGLRELLLPQGDRVSPEIAALFGSTDKAKMLAVGGVIDKENGKVLDEIKRTIKEEIQKHEPLKTLSLIGDNGDEY